MLFHFDLYRDRPLLVNVLDADFRADELPAMAEEANAHLGRLDRRVYYIIDLGDVRLSVGDILLGARLAARGASPPLHHANIIETMVVSTDPMIRMAAKSVDSHLFGHLKLQVFATFDEALRCVDEKISTST